MFLFPVLGNDATLVSPTPIFGSLVFERWAIIIKEDVNNINSLWVHLLQDAKRTQRARVTFSSQRNPSTWNSFGLKFRQRGCCNKSTCCFLTTLSVFVSFLIGQQNRNCSDAPTKFAKNRACFYCARSLALNLPYVSYRTAVPQAS